MRLKDVFLGAALMAGALTGPGAYYGLQSHSEDVRTRVTGKVEMAPDPDPAHRAYFIYTDKGKFDTQDMSSGAQIQPGAFYQFNVKGARFQYWPPSYSRSIQTARKIDGPSN